MAFTQAVYPIVAYRNGVVREPLVIKRDAVVLDLTGMKARMQVRLKAGDPTLDLDINSAAPNANGSVITFTAPTAGALEIYISNADLALVPTANPVSDDFVANYDMIFTATNGDYLPLVTGSFTVKEGITRMPSP